MAVKKILPGMLLDKSFADGSSKIVVVALLGICFFPVDPGLGLTFTSVFVALSVEDPKEYIRI